MICKAKYIKDFQIKVYFTDGTIRSIDLFRFLSSSNHPLINKYLDIELFKQFRIEMGTLCWGENEFDLNPMNMYNGKYDTDSGSQKSIIENSLKLKTSKVARTKIKKAKTDVFNALK